jgi:hypothetical protein
MTAPTVQILLDDFGGGFPYDITAYQEGDLVWQRGTADEQSSIGAGTLTLTLDNTDGRFTYGATTLTSGLGFGTVPFGSGTFGGVTGIGLNQQIRVLVNGQVRWTGRVQAWPVSWPAGSDKFSYVTVTAVDDLARAARWTLRSSLAEEILSDAPVAYWPLSEPEGATMGADVSGNLPTPLTFAGSGSVPTFGTGTGPPGDSATALQMFGGKYLTSANSSIILPGSGWTLAAFVLIPTVPLSPTLLFYTQGAVDFTLVTVDTSGHIIVGSVTSSVSVADNQTHHIALVWNGITVSLYVDGVSQGSWARALTDMTLIDVGGPDSAPLGLLSMTGTVAHVAAFGSALSGARIAAHYSAGMLDFNGETPAARITRVAGYMDLPVGTLSTSGATLMASAQQAGRSVLDVLDEIRATTLGVIYLNGSGAVTYKSGYAITQETAATAVHVQEYVSGDTTVEVDMTNVVNNLTGHADGSENLTIYKDAASIVVHGSYPADYTWMVSTDDQARDLTTWMGYTYASPSPRTPTLTYAVRKMDASNTTQALLLEIGVFASVTGMPSQTPGGDLFLIIDGLTETLTGGGDWTITVNATSHTVSVAAILDDSFFGVLDTSTKLYV